MPDIELTKAAKARLIKDIMDLMDTIPQFKEATEKMEEAERESFILKFQERVGEWWSDLNFTVDY